MASKKINFKTPKLAVFLLNLLIILLCNNSSNNSLRAQTVDQNLINQQDWVTRNLQNQIDEDKRVKEQKAIEKERNQNKKQINDDQEKPTTLNDNQECIIIKSITLIDANLLTARQQKKLTSQFINKCAESKIVNQIINIVQNFYNQKGYVATRVLVPRQNIKSGQLQIKILEGKINKLFIGKNNFLKQMQKFTAFGIIDGKVLNLQDINQGLYQINRLPSNQATMKIEPAQKEGEANIYIEDKKQFPDNFPARATISYDNLGNDFTGVKRTNFSGSIDNLLSLNDALNITYSTNLNDDNKVKNNKSFSSNISIPLAYNTISFDYSRSEFLGTNAGINGPIRISGFSQRNNFALDRVLLNNNDLRISMIATLSNSSSASYLNKQKIETSIRRLTIANLAFSISDQFKNGVNIYLKPSYAKGLKLLNANQDQPDIAPEIPRAQFDYFKLYGSISKRLIIPKINLALSISSEFDSQYSKQTLLGSQQFSVGGYYSVRGFRENYITGDCGYYFRNKVNLNIGSITAKFVKNNQSFFAKNLAHFNKFSVEPFFDYGYVKNKYILNGADGRMSGGGIKTIFVDKYFRASLTYSSAINQSRLINSNKKENKLIYFEVSASCCN